MSGKNKWSKYLILKRSEQLAPYLPNTKRLTRSAFWKFIEKYDHVILKPVHGSGGKGVIQVSSLGNRRCDVHREKTKKTIRGKKQTYSYVKRKIGSSDYMVQRRIHLATVHNRPFDMRIIVQRRRNSGVWTVTAKVAKVAGKGYIVTNNTRSKGTILHVKTALRRSSLNGHSPQRLLYDVKRIALLSAKRLSAFFPRHRIYGMDMGLDENGRVWVIETNHYPAMSHFRKLGDKAMCRRILAYKKS
ncbi:YheC/YheD family protein [Brevibacillus sp. NRS-1366]|uniref:YheC/YheD family protein n=1 Tax=Brevibacillus sp. NRS-1366 TaxID=3233899 RepID=UPI003D1F9E94